MFQAPFTGGILGPRSYRLPQVWYIRYTWPPQVVAVFAALREPRSPRQSEEHVYARRVVALRFCVIRSRSLPLFLTDRAK